MGKFDGILICTDLDGTLLRKDGSISPENLAAMEHFKAEGGYFTFITGRMPYYAMHICDAIQPNVPFGCVNGGGVAIEKLAEHLGTDKTVAIGDYNNDISMFQAAKLGIAVANACPEALAAADYVTVSNEEHAIARVISDLESGALGFDTKE